MVQVTLYLKKLSARLTSAFLFAKGESMNNINTKRGGVKVRIIATGEEFNSAQACADYLGVSGGWVRNVALGLIGAVTCHGYHIERVDDPKPRSLNRRGRPGTKVRIIENGMIFDSVRECARYIDGGHKYILLAIRTNSSYKNYHFEFVD